MVRHSIKLTAQHLSKSGLIVLAGFCVTCPVTLPFPGAVLAPKLWSVENGLSWPRGKEMTKMCFWVHFTSRTWGCYIPSLRTELQSRRSWSSRTTYSTVPSLHSPSLGVYPQSHTLLRYTTGGEKMTQISPVIRWGRWSSLCCPDLPAVTFNIQGSVTVRPLHQRR